MAAESTRKTVLFYRDFRYFAGGHLKVFHYYQHVRASEAYRAAIAFSAETVWDASNPWLPYRSRAVRWNPRDADVLFLAGVDWAAAAGMGAGEVDRPVVNLVQHVRHARDEPLRGFLANRAVRICVSPEVQEAILATGRVNGPTVAIPNGIAELPVAAHDWPRAAQRLPVLVLATKNTEFARGLAADLQADGIDVRLHDRFVPRADFLDMLGRHAVTVCCPDPTEGFYLPALEAMGRGSLVVCPDCVGNRSFCVDGVTALRPDYDRAAIVAAVVRATRLPGDAFDALRGAAAARAAEHSLERERAAFLEVLDALPALWSAS